MNLTTSRDLQMTINNEQLSISVWREHHKDCATPDIWEQWRMQGHTKIHMITVMDLIPSNA